MNSLSHGFLFLCGLTWLLCEVCVGAGAGYWTPLWLYLAGFTVMFTIMGCLPVSEKTINFSGPVFTILIGLGIAYYGVEALGSGWLGAALRLLGAAILLVLGAVSFTGRESAAHSH